MSVLAVTIAQTTGQSGLINFLPLVLIFGIFYFLLIAPMRKRQKQLQQMLSELKKGDRVVTNGGIHGEVYALDEETLLLKVAENVRIKVARSAISGKQGEEDS